MPRVPCGDGRYGQGQPERRKLNSILALFPFPADHRQPVSIPNSSHSFCILRACAGHALGSVSSPSCSMAPVLVLISLQFPSCADRPFRSESSLLPACSLSRRFTGSALLTGQRCLQPQRAAWAGLGDALKAASTLGLLGGLGAQDTLLLWENQFSDASNTPTPGQGLKHLRGLSANRPPWC